MVPTFEVLCIDGWTVQAIGDSVREYRLNDDWTEDRRRRLEAKDYNAAMTLLQRIVELHGGPSTAELREPLFIPTAEAIKLANGEAIHITEYWLDADGLPCYGFTRGQPVFAMSRKIHERLCRYVDRCLNSERKETKDDPTSN